jgi:predicted phosphodiesterase
MDKHELISALKDLALELGRTPTRSEYVSRVRGGDYQLTKFGGFTALLLAAGLDTYDTRRGGKARKIDNSIFEKDIERHLEEYQPRPVLPRKPYPRLAVISDVHWPFDNARVIEAFHSHIEKTQHDWVILNGDAWDMYSHSKYPRSHNVFTPREEERLSRERNEEFWKEVQKRCPKAKCVQMMGNHDVRPFKRVLDAYPEAEDWIAEKMGKLFTFDGVKTIMDPREELFVSEDTIVFHGYRSQPGAHRDYTLYNCINGHTPVGGAVFRRLRGQTLWELNSGVAGDPEAKGLTYTPQKITNWTPGFAEVDTDGPRFIPV